MYATLHWFSSLAPVGQVDKGSSPALLILTMEQPLLSINALVLTLFRLAESCIFKWFGYILGIAMPLPWKMKYRPMAIPTSLLIDETGNIIWIDQSADYRLRASEAALMSAVKNSLSIK
ncbi:hypothetical protein [Cognaticolwellia aestuarii]|uniref:hypothetical protein n=1 Tax=Cognaticolwellia aestuarii TaxID=329993 RepID=UPI000986FF3B|nr:hypothetical protein [Cognaticolwellia aestuarii]